MRSQRKYGRKPQHDKIEDILKQIAKNTEILASTVEQYHGCQSPTPELRVRKG